MTTDDDPRTGHHDSDTVTIESGDDDTPQTVVSIPSDALFKPTHIKVEYDDAGTVDAIVNFFDDADGTSAANVADQRETVQNVAPGDRIEIDGPYREFEEDVLAKTEGGNQDGDVEVTVKGVMLTDLEDMTGRF